MNKTKMTAAALAAICALPAPTRAMGMMGMMGGTPARHTYFMRHGLPPNYANMANPLQPTPANLKAGKQLYEQNCAACHGMKGKGDGEAGKALKPPPSDLAQLVAMPMASDGYLYWSIAEGGSAFGTAMPAMKDALPGEDIWKVVLYLRAF